MTETDVWHGGNNQWMLYVTDKNVAKKLLRRVGFTLNATYLSSKREWIGQQFRFDGGLPLHKERSLLGQVMAEFDMSWSMLKHMKPRVVTNSDPEPTMTYREAEREFGVKKRRKKS